MSTGFPALVSFSGSVIFFAYAVKLRKFKVPVPRSAARFSLEERQKRIRTTSWLLFFSGLFLLAGAIFFEISALKT